MKTNAKYSTAIFIYFILLDKVFLLVLVRAPVKAFEDKYFLSNMEIYSPKLSSNYVRPLCQQFTENNWP